MLPFSFDLEENWYGSKKTHNMFLYKNVRLQNHTINVVIFAFINTEKRVTIILIFCFFSLVVWYVYKKTCSCNKRSPNQWNFRKVAIWGGMWQVCCKWNVRYDLTNRNDLSIINFKKVKFLISYLLTLFHFV